MIRVQNPRDPPADSKPACEPIYSELTLFVQESKNIIPLAGKEEVDAPFPRTQLPLRPLALTFGTSLARRDFALRMTRLEISQCWQV